MFLWFVARPSLHARCGSIWTVYGGRLGAGAGGSEASTTRRARAVVPLIDVRAVRLRSMLVAWRA